MGFKICRDIIHSWDETEMNCSKNADFHWVRGRPLGWCGIQKCTYGIIMVHLFILVACFCISALAWQNIARVEVVVNCVKLEYFYVRFVMYRSQNSFKWPEITLMDTNNCPRSKYTFLEWFWYLFLWCKLKVVKSCAKFCPIL